MNRRRKTIAGIKGTPAEKRNDQIVLLKNLLSPSQRAPVVLSPKSKPVKSGTSPSEDSAGIKKFRKDLAAKRKFAAEMGTIRNTVGLQPGAKEGVTGAKFDQKQYSNPPRKVKIDPVQNRRQKRRRQRQ